jgi:hypothetical protein
MDDQQIIIYGAVFPGLSNIRIFFSTQGKGSSIHPLGRKILHNMKMVVLRKVGNSLTIKVCSGSAKNLRDP